MNKSNFFLLYLINPFFALIREIQNLEKTSLPHVLMLFCAFYGSSQMLGEAGVRYKDSSAYRDRLIEFHDKNVSLETFKSSLLDGETTFDIVIPLIIYFTSLFTSEAKILFLICGLIFGYFYGKNIEFILQNLSIDKYNKFLLFLILVFALIIPFWSGLNGLRMWMGAHVFFYGVSRHLKYSKSKYLAFIILASLFHFSLVTIVGIYLTFIFTPLNRYTTIYFGLYLVSFLLAEANLGFITEFIRNNSPAIFQAKTDIYTKDVYVETFTANFVEGRSWHAILYEKVLLYSMFFLVIVTYILNKREKIFDNSQNVYFSFALLLLSFANFISQLPSGGRFYKIAFLFTLIPLSFFYSRTKYKKLFHFTFIPLLFWMVVNIRDGFDHLTLATFLANPLLIWFDFLNQVPMIDYIK